MLTTLETYGEAAVRILHTICLPEIDPIDYLVDELVDVQRATRDQMETGGEG